MVRVSFRSVAKILLPVAGFACGTPSLAATRDCFAGLSNKPINVLFVGNSFTYFNNMPAMAEAIAAANGIKLKTGIVASGGETLHDHLTSGDAAKALSAFPWDYVFLQEQSSFGDTYLVNGKFRIRPTYRWIGDACASPAQSRYC